MRRKVGQAGGGEAVRATMFSDQQPLEMLCPSSKGCCGQGFTLSNIKYSKKNVFLASSSDRIHHEGKIKKNCFFGNRIIKGQAFLSDWHWREQSRWKCKKEWKIKGVAQKGPRSNWRLELTDQNQCSVDSVGHWRLWTSWPWNWETKMMSEERRVQNRTTYIWLAFSFKFEYFVESFLFLPQLTHVQTLTDPPREDFLSVFEEGAFPFV